MRAWHFSGGLGRRNIHEVNDNKIYLSVTSHAYCIKPPGLCCLLLQWLAFCFAVKTTRTPPAAISLAVTNGTPTPRSSRITKPPVPKQTPLEKKPPVPRAPRNIRPTNAPLPDLKNVRSKIGSTDNMKYQPGGGKVSWLVKRKPEEFACAQRMK